MVVAKNTIFDKNRNWIFFFRCSYIWLKNEIHLKVNKFSGLYNMKGYSHTIPHIIQKYTKKYKAAKV